MAGRSATDIAIAIEREITTGVLSPGSKLTPVRQLAADLGVSPTTVASSYRRLRDRGLVVGTGRQGTRVAPQSNPLPPQPIVVPANTIDAISGNPDPQYLPSLAAAIAATESSDTAQYGGPLVDSTLKSVATALFTADGIDSTNITVSSGAMDAVQRVIEAQEFRAGDRIGVEDPGHIPVHQLVRRAGLELVPIPIDQAGMTPTGLRAALATGLAAVIVTPRAQNPTGAAFTTARAAELNSVLAEYPNTALLLDDHAGGISGVPFVGLDAPGRRWATIRSLGKALGPDLRVALVAGDELTINRVSLSISNGPGWVSHILQRAAAHLLTDQPATSLVQAAAESYAARRQRFIELLASNGIAGFAASGFNVWIPVADEQAAVEAARAAGFAVRAADPYRVASAPAVRVTLSLLDDAACQRLAAAIGSHIGEPAMSPAI